MCSTIRSVRIPVLWTRGGEETLLPHVRGWGRGDSPGRGRGGVRGGHQPENQETLRMLCQEALVSRDFVFVSNSQETYYLPLSAPPSDPSGCSPSWRRWTSRRWRGAPPGSWSSGSPRARTAPGASRHAAARRRVPPWWWTSWSSSLRSKGRDT